MALKSLPLLTNSVINFSILILLIFCCLGIYWPGLSGIFLLDDYHNLSALNQHGGVTDLNSFLAFVFSNNSGTAGRPISMMSFLLNDQAWPGSPWSFKYTNLLIHVICGLLIIALVYRISITLKLGDETAKLLAYFCGAFWMFHPFNVSTTLYVIQRMTQLATLFTLAGVLLYCYGRQIYKEKPTKSLALMSISIILFGSLAFLSKENGILLIVYVLVIEATIFHNANKPNSFRIWFIVFILLPLICVLAFFASRGFYLSAYETRDFTLVQRLMTESRILVEYLHSIIVPPLKGTGLVHDDIIISSSFFTPLTTFTSIIANLSFLCFAIYFRKRQPVYAFAVFWFYGGHVLESTFIPLELYFEHRNYLPMVGPIFGVIFYLLLLYQRMTKIIHKSLILFVPLFAISITMVFTYQSTTIWSNPNSLFAVWAHEHPDSLRAQRIYAQNLAINGNPLQAIEKLNQTYDKFPYDISLPLEIINISCSNDLESPYNMEDITKLSKISRFTDGIWPITKSLIDSIVKSRCLLYTIEDAISLLATIETIEKVDKNHKTFAQMLFLHSDLYVLTRQLTPAIKLLDRAFQYQGTITIPLRQAQLLISAGLYQDAINYISLAKQTDAARRRFVPSQIGELNKLENSIRNHL